QQYLGDDSLFQRMVGDTYTLGLGTPGKLGFADGDLSTALFYSIAYISHDGLALSDGNVIRSLTTAGGLKVQTVAGLQTLAGSVDGVGPGSAFVITIGIAVDDSGHAWVSEQGRLRRVDLTTRAVTSVFVTPTPSPSPGPPAIFEGLAWYSGKIYLP